MSRSLLKSGGPLKVQRQGGDRYRVSISLPTDPEGRLARECPEESCSPGYFKMMLDTGREGDPALAYCPYCRRQADPSDFDTKEQHRYARDLIDREVRKGVDEMVRESFGLGPSGQRKSGNGLFSVEVKFKPAPLPYVRPPYEDEARRDVVCPHCALDHTVFGLAAWCPNCGVDIFLTHVAAELAVVRSMAEDTERRRSLLGRRVVAKDLENCLEDAVSIFEAAMKAMTRRCLSGRGLSSDAVEARLNRIGNAYQSVARTLKLLAEEFEIDAVPQVDWNTLSAALEKRHPITHNLGVVDKKYLERSQSADHQGRELNLTQAEVCTTLDGVLAALSEVHARMFPVADTK